MSRLAPRVRVRSGGRSEQVRQRVAAACLELLADGHVDLGPVEVARRSGVSRATLHRWWPTKDDLLREALAHHTRSLEPPDTGTWAGDLHALLRQLAGFFADPIEVGQNVVMASGAHPSYDRAVLEHYAPLFVAWRAIVERAQARGEVAGEVDPDALLLLLASPLLLVPLLYRRALTTVELDGLEALLLRATTP